MQRQLRDAALAVGGIELPGARAGLVEEQIGKVVAAKVTGDDLAPRCPPVRVQGELRDTALTVGRVELSRSRGGVIEEQIGEAAAAKITRDDVCPTRAPTRVLRQQCDPAAIVGPVEFAGPCRRIVEQQVGEAVAAAEVAWDDLRPGAAPAEVESRPGDASLAVGGVELALPHGRVVIQQSLHERVSRWTLP